MIQLFYCCFAFVDTSPAVNNQQSDGMLMLWFSSDLNMFEDDYMNVIIHVIHVYVT